MNSISSSPADDAALLNRIVKIACVPLDKLQCPTQCQDSEQAVWNFAESNKNFTSLSAMSPRSCLDSSGR